MLKLNIRSLLLNKGIESPYAWITKRGISTRSAQKLVSGKMDRVRVRHIEMICRDIHCTPNDLFAWEPDGKTGQLPGHPLWQLAHNDDLIGIRDTIIEMTPNQIRKLHEKAKEIMGDGEESNE